MVKVSCDCSCDRLFRDHCHMTGDMADPNHKNNIDSSDVCEDDGSSSSHNSFKKENVNLQRIRDQAEALQNEMMTKINRELKEMFEMFMQEVEKIEQNGSMGNPWGEPKPKKRKPGELPEKTYVARRSVLSELFEIKHIQTIYHIFVAILILFSLSTIVYDIIDSGKSGLDFEMILWGFGKFPHVVTMWLCMQLSTLLIVYPSFHYWSVLRSPIRPYWLDVVWLVVFLAYQLSFIILPIMYIIEHELPPASTLVIVTEQVRLLMKVHSFVRENTARIITYQTRKKDDTEDREIPSPGFSRYIYFLFAPTLVYRDVYPRTQRINWNYVFTNFAQVLACLFYTYYIFERFCYPVFRNFNHEHITPKRLLLSVFGCMLPGTLVLLIGFFGILHSWFNAFAEMLRFADRMFYRDWWNSTAFSTFYRSWNGVVHDWLYSYIYKDASYFFGPQYRPLSLGCVFFISAVVHEYIITMALGFFYPVLFLMFAVGGFAVLFVTEKASSRNWNVFLWTSLFLGNGLLMCLYSMEYFARRTCPISDATFLDYLTPRSWTCDFAAQNITS